MKLKGKVELISFKRERESVTTQAHNSTTYKGLKAALKMLNLSCRAPNNLMWISVSHTRTRAHTEIDREI